MVLSGCWCVCVCEEDVVDDDDGNDPRAESLDSYILKIESNSKPPEMVVLELTPHH